MSDADIVRFLCSQEKAERETGSNALVDKYHLELLRRATAFWKGDSAQAEDSVMVALLRACKRIDGLEKPESLHAWLVKILMNYCIDEWRKSHPIWPEGEGDKVISIEKVGEIGDSDVLLEDDWLAVSADCRTVLGRYCSKTDAELLEQKWLKDKSFEQLARERGMKPSTVKVSLHRAENRLFKKLGEHQIRQPGGLEVIMSAGEATVFRRRYVLGRRIDEIYLEECNLDPDMIKQRLHSAEKKVLLSAMGRLK